jgi:hypothetical protein
LFLIAILLPLCTLGQGEGDTLTEAKSNKRSFQERWHEQPSPLKATVFSAVVPGAGQLYNRKYWKAPIVWAAVGTCLYFIGRNGKEYQFYKSEYIKAADLDPLTQSEYSAEQIKPVMDTYRQWLDMSYFSLLGVYALQVIDAHVDAHLSTFDISRDLSLHWSPIGIQSPGKTKLGLSLSLQF